MLMGQSTASPPPVEIRLRFLLASGIPFVAWIDAHEQRAAPPMIKPFIILVVLVLMAPIIYLLFCTSVVDRMFMRFRGGNASMGNKAGRPQRQATEVEAEVVSVTDMPKDPPEPIDPSRKQNYP